MHAPKSGLGSTTSIRLRFDRLVAYSTNQLPLNMAALPVAELADEHCLLVMWWVGAMPQEAIDRSAYLAALGRNSQRALTELEDANRAAGERCARRPSAANDSSASYDHAPKRRLDVPPILSSTAIWSPIPNHKEIGREEALFRRTDHRLPA